MKGHGSSGVRWTIAENLKNGVPESSPACEVSLENNNYALDLQLSQISNIQVMS
jgi:hypothetical protein